MPEVVYTPDKHPISAVRVVPASPQYTTGKNPVRAVRIIDGPVGDVYTPAGFPVRAVRLVDAAGVYTASQTPITSQPEVMFTPDKHPIEHVCLIADASPEVVWTVDGRPIEAVRLVGTAGQSASSAYYDFTTGSLPAGMTFTRASAAWGHNSAGVLTSYAIDAPRFVYDPLTLQNLGLLVEGARTNSLRNNTMAGTVAGTPGTPPTNWVITAPANNLVREIIGTGTEDGIDYLDIRWSGTPSATSLSVHQMEVASLVPAVAGQVWTGSYYLRVVGGSLSNVSLLLQSSGRAGTTFVFGTPVAITPTTAALRTQRFSVTQTLVGGTITGVDLDMRLNYTNALAIDVTLRIGLPQLEMAEVTSGTLSALNGASSPIKTSTVAVARAADVANITNATALTDKAFVVRGRTAPGLPIGSLTQMILHIDDGAVTNRKGIFRGTTGLISCVVSTASVSQAVINSSVLADNTDYAVAVRFDDNNTAASFNGAAVIADTSCTMPGGLVAARVGRIGTSTHTVYSTIKSIETRATASDAELVILSTV